MALFRIIPILILLATAGITVTCLGTAPDTATDAASGSEASEETAAADPERPFEKLEMALAGTRNGQPSGFARIPTEQVVRDYYAQTLSVVPASMFSSAALQLAFAHSIDQPIDEHNNTLLHVASQSGDVYAVWQLLEFGANSEIANRFNELPVDVVYTANEQVSQSLTAAFSTHRDAIADIIFRRPGWTASTGAESTSADDPNGKASPIGVTMGVILR